MLGILSWSGQCLRSSRRYFLALARSSHGDHHPGIEPWELSFEGPAELSLAITIQWLCQRVVLLPTGFSGTIDPKWSFFLFRKAYLFFRGREIAAWPGCYSWFGGGQSFLRPYTEWSWCCDRMPSLMREEWSSPSQIHRASEGSSSAAEWAIMAGLTDDSLCSHRCMMVWSSTCLRGQPSCPLHL